MTKIVRGLCGILTGLLACSEQPHQTSCTLDQPTTSCTDGKVCEDVAGQPACVAPLVIRGRVLDQAAGAVSGALVAALDENDAPASGTATSGADGSYELRVPTPRAASGAPLARQLRLRAAAAGFDPFPSGLRRSVPLELSTAIASGAQLAVNSPAAELVLQRLPAAVGLGSIAGVVPANGRGVLLVAEGPTTASSISDTDGAFVIFNLAPGTYLVRGYAAGVQLAPASVTVTGDARTTATLGPRGTALGQVSGSVNIVNAPGGAMTSVVLVVASTFNQALARGQVPPGLRAPTPGQAPSVSGPFTITGVPDGDYLVLAAFENDNLVRDPDTAIGGTQIQRVSLGEAGRQITLPASFKVTEALTIMRPGASETPEIMDGPPTFVWKDDSSEERYALQVMDHRGNVVWSNDNIGKQSGGDVSVVYGGPALAPASLFQFRVTSFRKGDVAISQTEDLRGVFQTR
jgi:hypothetical protein